LAQELHQHGYDRIRAQYPDAAADEAAMQREKQAEPAVG